MPGFTDRRQSALYLAMKDNPYGQKKVGSATALAAIIVIGMTAAASAATPMTGPEFDKIMILNEAGDGPGFSVGEFAACADERIEALIVAGDRPRSTPRVSGALDGDVFMVTVPGESTPIEFFFVAVDGHPNALLLQSITIGAAKATSYGDKVGAITALVPNCL